MSTEDQIQQAVDEVTTNNIQWHLTTFSSKDAKDIIKWAEFAVRHDVAVAVGVKTPRLFVQCVSTLQRDGLPHDVVAFPPGWRWVVFNRGACKAVVGHALASVGIPRRQRPLIEAH